MDGLEWNCFSVREGGWRLGGAARTWLWGPGRGGMVVVDIVNVGG